MDNRDIYLTGQQLEIPVFPVKKDRVEGGQIGALNNGIAYLPMGGLSRFCGVDPTAISRLTTASLISNLIPAS